MVVGVGSGQVSGDAVHGQVFEKLVADLVLLDRRLLVEPELLLRSVQQVLLMEETVFEAFVLGEALAVGGVIAGEGGGQTV